MTAYPSAPVDHDQLTIDDAIAEQRAVVEAVADDPDYSRFLMVCEAVALADPDRLVKVNAVREFVTEHGIDIEHHRYSAFWQKATSKAGPMENVFKDDGSPLLDSCKPTKTGRNGGKWQQVRRWVA